MYTVPKICITQQNGYCVILLLPLGNELRGVMGQGHQERTQGRFLGLLPQDQSELDKVNANACIDCELKAQAHS